MRLEAEVKSIKKILVDDEKFYQIPDYQRPYSWDKENLSALVEDLITAFIEKRDEEYFCGSLVLVNNETDGRYDIIDGQQRTTTFTILACVIRDLYSDKLSPKANDYINLSIQDKYDTQKRKLKFLTNDDYQNSFEQNVLKGIHFINTKHIERDFKDNIYLQNAHFLKEFLSENINENAIDIDIFTIWFFEKVVLTVIACPSQDTAINIFNVLNNRGLPLSPIDILKSSLMQKLNDSKEDRNSFRSEWENVSKKLGYYDFEFEQMLTIYLYYKITSNPKSRLDKELLAVFSNEKKNSLEIVNEISNFANSYIELLTSQDKYINSFKYLRHEMYWKSILTTAIFNNYEKIEELKEILLAYYYQNWISGATIARIKQTSFNVLELVKEKASIEKIKEKIKENLDRYSTTPTFKDELLSSNIYNRNWSKSLLLVVEYFWTETQTASFIALDKKLHLEHILPQEPKTYGWDNIFSEAEIMNLTNSLGNLTLLSLRKNIQALNYNFEGKKEAYQNKDNVVSSFIITQDIINKYDTWDADAVEKRKNFLLEKIYRKLDIF